MKIEPSSVVVQAKEQISCELDNEVAILSLKSSLYFGLDEVGSLIWQELVQPRSVDEICRSVVDQFDVEQSQCRADVIAFLQELAEAGLVEVTTLP